MCSVFVTKFKFETIFFKQSYGYHVICSVFRIVQLSTLPKPRAYISGPKIQLSISNKTLVSHVQSAVCIIYLLQKPHITYKFQVRTLNNNSFISQEITNYGL